MTIRRLKGLRMEIVMVAGLMLAMALVLAMCAMYSARETQRLTQDGGR